MNVDVYLDSGASVEVPNGTDVNSEEGIKLIECLARSKFLEQLQDPRFIFDYDIEYDDGEEICTS